ncbi:PAS domain-containing protein [Candidatus Poribacteria bacterium]|nr:PAS domain-containing protein [Candidatus Poribacteria bacterium]
MSLKIELIKQIGWLVKLRWIAITGVFVTVGVASWGLHIIEQPLPLFVIATLMVLYNFEPQIYPKHITEKPLASIKRHAGAHIILDVLSLTALIHFSGGVENPFIFYFIFHLIIASIILSKRVSYILATFNTALLSSLIFLEYYHILPHYHLENFLPETLWRDGLYISSVLFVFTSTLFFSVYLATSIMDTARAREAETLELKESLEEKVVELEKTRKEVLFERNKLKSIIECMQEGVVFVDDKHRVSLFNKAAQQIRKEPHPPPPLSTSVWRGGRGVRLENNLCPETYGPLLQIAEELSTGHDVIEHQSLQLKDKFFENTYSAVRDDTGHYLGTVLVCREVTDRKRMEQQMIQSEKMAAIGELAAGVAHEINNPLDGLLNCILRIKRNPKNEEQTQEYLDLMEEAIRRIESTVGQLLNFSRKHELELTLISLNEVVDEVAVLIAYSADEKGIRIDEQFQADLAPILGDKHFLEQVVLNLGLNAIAAMPDGGVLTFKTGKIEFDSLLGEAAVYVQVTDTGVGIPKSVQDRIFDPFYTTKLTEKGTGLGLSVSNRIVRQHEGVIEFESEVGRGTTFTVKLPIREQEVQGFRSSGEERKWGK